MIVDANTHISPRSAVAVPPARLATYAGVAGIDVLLVSNRDAAAGAGGADIDETSANLDTLDAARTCPKIRALYWVRPGATDSNVYAFAGALESEPFVGAVISPADSAVPADDRRIEPYLAWLTEIDRPAVFLIAAGDYASPARVYKAARRHPRLNVLLCQTDSTPVCQTQSIDVARTARARNDARLFLDTSYMSAAAIRTAVEQLGAGWVVLGTNALAMGDAHTPRQIALLDELRRQLTPSEFAGVAGGNAARLFNLAD
jgi:predicted TIM-barrel fold metal-dependent hydrolase